MIVKSDAAEAIKQINHYLSVRRDDLATQNKKFKIHSMGVVDPNGPKGIPFLELKELSANHGDICDLLINMNVSALKRVWGLEDGKVRGWWAEWIDTYDRFVLDLGEDYHSNWIRANRPGIAGWTMLGFWAYSPPNKWNFNGVNGGFYPYKEARISWES
jgi:hypothetical protein